MSLISSSININREQIFIDREQVIDILREVAAVEGGRLREDLSVTPSGRIERFFESLFFGHSGSPSLKRTYTFLNVMKVYAGRHKDPEVDDALFNAVASFNKTTLHQKIIYIDELITRKKLFELPDDILAHILSFMPVEDMQHHRLASNHFKMLVDRVNRQVKTLILQCSSLTEEHIRNLYERFPKVEHLGLTSIEHLSMIHWDLMGLSFGPKVSFVRFEQRPVERLPHVKRVSMNLADIGQEPDHFHAFLKSLPPLTELNCSGKHIEIAADIELSQLEQIDLTRCQATTMDFLSRAERLKGISLEAFQLEAFQGVIDLRLIQNLPLEYVNLSANSLEALSSEALLEFVKNATRLKTLVLNSVPAVTDEVIAALPKTLEKLSVCHCKNITPDSFTNLPEALIDLAVAYTSFDDEGIISLSHRIVVLNISGCSNVTDFGLGYLPQNIHTLYFNDYNKENVTERGFAYIWELKKLEVLQGHHCIPHPYHHSYHSVSYRECHRKAKAEGESSCDAAASVVDWNNP